MLAQILPTPLTRLRWWRVCLDEAQMVENTTAKAAALAVEIRAQHRCAAVPYLQPSCCPCSFHASSDAWHWRWT